MKTVAINFKNGIKLTSENFTEIEIQNLAKIHGEVDYFGYEKNQKEYSQKEINENWINVFGD